MCDVGECVVDWAELETSKHIEFAGAACTANCKISQNIATLVQLLSLQ